MTLDREGGQKGMIEKIWGQRTETATGGGRKRRKISHKEFVNTNNNNNKQNPCGSKNIIFLTVF
jgi:hypothetical protein